MGSMLEFSLVYNSLVYLTYNFKNLYEDYMTAAFIGVGNIAFLELLGLVLRLG